MTESRDAFSIKIDQYFDIYPAENSKPNSTISPFTTELNESLTSTIRELEKYNKNTFTGMYGFNKEHIYKLRYL